MKRSNWILVSFALVAVMAGGIANPSFASTPATLNRDLDEYLSAQRGENLIPTLAVGVVNRDGIIYLKTFGPDGGQGNVAASDKPFVIGSLSKSFTAVAVMQLHESGKLELDTPVRHYLPWFRLRDEKASAAITVRHLLNQNSGLDASAPRARGADRSLEGHVRALSDAVLAGTPGGGHIYSSPNYQILGLLVERVSGLSFGDYVSRNIFVPLGMTDSHVTLASARKDGLASGHNIWFGVPVAAERRFEEDRLPTASLVSSARDLARYLVANLNRGAHAGGRILSPESMAVLHRGVAEAEGFRYAMGWREGPTAGVPSLWHGGALPNYRGALVLLPREGYGIVVLSNVSTMFGDQTRLIASGIVARLMGRPRTETRPLRNTFGWIAAGALLLLVWQTRTLLKLRYWDAEVERLRLAGGRASVMRRLAIFDLLLPFGIIVMLPRWVGVSWRGMYEGAPDLITFGALMMAISGAVAIFKIGKLRKGQDATPSPSVPQT